MAKKEKITLNGQPVGRIKAGWLLFKEAFRFMWADKEMLWLPVISLFANLILLGFIVGIIVVAALALSPEFFEKYPVEYFFIFLAYVAGAFVLAFSQAAVTHLVFVRAHGGDATLGQALKKAFSHWWGLLMWSVITATVGVILRIIYDRSKLLGQIITSLIGAAWSILTYFVVPAIVIDNQGPFDSIKKSAVVFKHTWGETMVSNISYVGIFMIAHLLALFSIMGIVIFGAVLNSVPVMILGLIVAVVWIVGFSLISSSIAAVLRTLLYIYATEGSVPLNFDRELLEKMLVRSNVDATPVPEATTHQNAVG